ncbi:glycosyltransferase family 4 protein [Clostridiaceae bacterium UIB06]|nr:glycosyltransferase family 4 protein [Clostridiaceae bacterium UIB06]
MKILMLSWEYPPKNVGGLSNHVYYLSQALSKMGHEIHVITCEEGTAPLQENDNGVFVHRVTPYKIDTGDFAKWVMQLNFAMIEEAIKTITAGGKFDIIHAHDWLSAFSAKTLKSSFKIPTVCTIHATEYGRNGGIRTDMQKYISSTEWFLSYEAWKVVACSNYMRHQISKIFSVPWEKIWVIPNGVEPEKFDFKFDWLNFRRKYARDEEKIIFYIGRHVFEKGIHLLIESAQGIISRYNNSKFVIAGTGPMTNELKHRVRQMGIESKFVFTGYMSDEDRDKLYRVANIAVFPSLYEPFGIVALEAMAAGCPVVVSDTGGLGEIVEHKVNGLKTINGSSESIIDNISQLLYNDELANRIKENAMKCVYEKYTWNKIAETTICMYNWVKDEAKGTEWEIRTSKEDKHGDSVALKKDIKNVIKEKSKSTKESLEDIAFKTIETVDNISGVKDKIADKTKETVNNVSDTVTSVKGKISTKTKQVTDGALDIKHKISSKTKEAAVGIKEGISEIKEKLSKENETNLDNK